MKFGFGEITLDRTGCFAPWALYVILRYGNETRQAVGFVVKPAGAKLLYSQRAKRVGKTFFGLYFRTYAKQRGAR